MLEIFTEYLVTHTLTAETFVSPTRSWLVFLVSQLPSENISFFTEEIEETADENKKTDSNTRVDTTIGVAINCPCNDNVKYNCDDEDNSSYNYEHDNVVPIKPADDVLPNKSVIGLSISTFFISC